MQQQYLEIYIQTPSQLEDVLVGFLFSMGAEGVSENLTFIQEDQYLQVSLVEHTSKNLVAYFLPVNPSELVMQIKSQFPDCEVSYEVKDTKDWLAEWKKSFVPFQLTQGVWICPSWCHPPQEAQEIIFMEPGMSFGTGTHPTTQLCCDFICELHSRYKFENAIDVGCGTGILSILMSKVGIKKIYAFDIDPESQRVCDENMEKNNVENVFWDKNWPDLKLSGPTLVVANIIDGTLRDLKPLLKKVLPTDGIMILSGILNERAASFLQNFLDDDFELILQNQKLEWFGVCLRKKNSA